MFTPRPLFAVSAAFLVSLGFSLNPRPSDIFMRTLTVRVSNQKEPLDTRQAVRDFSVTRLEWVYFADRDLDRRLIADLKDQVTVFGGSLNPTLGPLPGSDPFCRTLDGSPATVPWLRVYKNDRTNMCVTHPLAFAALTNQVALQLRLGVGAFQVDDVAMNGDVMRSSGGCFCDPCVSGFESHARAKGLLAPYGAKGWGDGKAFNIRTYLLGKGVVSGDMTYNHSGFPAPLRADYEKYQQERVKDFLNRLQQATKALAGREIPLSKNTHEPWLEGVLDYTMVELPWGNASPGYIEKFIGHQRALGSTVVFDGPKKYPMTEADLPTLRASFASAYGAGGYGFVPWDMFTAPAKPRYFVKPGDFSDLTSFIKNNRALFDDFPRVVADDRNPAAGKRVSASVASAMPVAVFSHVPASGPGKAAVVHVVRWGGGTGDVRVQLDGMALLSPATSAVKVTAFQPGKAPVVVHEGPVSPITSPLATWTLLQIEALPDSGALAAPLLFPFGGNLLAGQEIAVMTGAPSPGASGKKPRVVYTQDGKDPDDRSPILPESWKPVLAAGEKRTFKIRTIRGSEQSAITEVSFTGEKISKATNIEGATVPGCAYKFAEGDFRTQPDWAELNPTASGHTEFFHQGPRPVTVKAWAARYQAFLKVPTSGRYRIWGFFNAKKGDLKIQLDGEKIFQIATPGDMGSGEIVLEEGLHPITCDVMQNDPDGGKGSHYFFVGISGPGIAETRLTQEYLVRPR